MLRHWINPSRGSNVDREKGDTKYELDATELDSLIYARGA